MISLKNWCSYLTPPQVMLAGVCVFAAGLNISVSITEAGLALAFAAWVWGLAISDTQTETSPRAYGLAGPWLLYLAVGLFSSAFALDVKRAINYFPSDLIKAWACLFLLAALTKRHTRAALPFYLGGAVISVLVGLFKTTFYSLQSPHLFRANGFMNAVTFGEITALALLYPVISFITETDSGKKKLWALPASLMVLTLILSQSRGAMLGLFVSLITMACIEKRARKTVLYIGAAAVIAAAGLGAANRTVRAKLLSVPKAAYTKVMTLATGEKSTHAPIDYGAQTRLNQWRAAIEIIGDFPLFGVGPSNVKNIFHFYHPAPIDGQYGWSNVHNLYLQQGAERGLIGLGVLLYLLAGLFVYAWLPQRRTVTVCTLWAACAYPGFLAMNLTETSFQHAVVSMGMFFIIACAWADAGADK